MHAICRAELGAFSLNLRRACTAIRGMTTAGCGCETNVAARYSRDGVGPTASD